MNANQDKNAARLENKHNHKRNKKTILYSLGDSVSVLIPNIDRGGSDMPRLPGIVCRLTHDLYEISTKFGILNNCVRASDLEKYHGNVDFDYKLITNKISLRECARKFSNRSEDLGDVEISCNCKTKCDNRRCSCFAKQIKCNSHCHLKTKENFCINK